jgi:methionyl-tRNA formyltransferase
MKAVVVGAVESTRVALRTIAAASAWRVAAVITLPPTLAGRHSDFADLHDEAAAAKAELIEAANANAPEVVSRLAAIAPDVVFVIGWSQICGPEFRAAAKGRVLGFHPAPLPRLRGRAAIPWTVLLDEKISGSTLFWIDEGVDSGPILAQEFFHVAPDETATTLYARHMAALERILDAALKSIASGNDGGRKQDERYATYVSRRTQRDGLIDWSRSKEEVLRLVRAATRPYPGAWSTWKGRKFVVWGATPWAPGERHIATPGRVLTVENGAIAIACAGGAIMATEWTLDGEQDIRAHGALGGLERMEN